MRVRGTREDRTTLGKGTDDYRKSRVFEKAVTLSILEYVFSNYIVLLRRPLRTDREIELVPATISFNDRKV